MEKKMKSKLKPSLSMPQYSYFTRSSKKIPQSSSTKRTHSMTTRSSDSPIKPFTQSNIEMDQSKSQIIEIRVGPKHSPIYDTPITHPLTQCTTFKNHRTSIQKPISLTRGKPIKLARNLTRRELQDIFKKSSPQSGIVINNI